MSSPIARNRIRLTVAALAVGATVTTLGGTAQATPSPLNQPTPDTATPIATSSGSGFDPGIITGSAMAPIVLGGILLCEIEVNTGSTKWDPRMGGIPCLPI
ncbi:hypothetical protein [Nocardia sp. NPDC004722]